MALQLLHPRIPIEPRLAPTWLEAVSFRQRLLVYPDLVELIAVREVEAGVWPRCVPRGSARTDERDKRGELAGSALAFESEVKKKKIVRLS
jgi:hypothetical protein